MQGAIENNIHYLVELDRNNKSEADFLKEAEDLLVEEIEPIIQKKVKRDSDWYFYLWYYFWKLRLI